VTGIGRCADVRLSLGVYVLGAAEPAERALVRMHLAWCRECREELAALAGLPGLLRRVPGDEAERLFAGEADAAGQADPAFPADPPDGGTLPRLLSRTARTRRTRRWLAAAATAAAVAVATGSGVAAASGFGAGGSVIRPIHWETFSARNDVTLAGATVRYAPAPWGARVEVRVRGIAPGTACQLRVTGSHGQIRIAGSWTVVAGGYGTWIPASTSFPAESVTSFAVLSGHRTLVTVPATES
jgi:Putative zinc-finger